MVVMDFGEQIHGLLVAAGMARGGWRTALWILPVEGRDGEWLWCVVEPRAGIHRARPTWQSTSPPAIPNTTTHKQSVIGFPPAIPIPTTHNRSVICSPSFITITNSHSRRSDESDPSDPRNSLRSATVSSSAHPCRTPAARGRSRDRRAAARVRATLRFRAGDARSDRRPADEPTRPVCHPAADRV